MGGYFIYASLFAAVGSAVGEDQGEAQSLTLPIMLPIIIAFFKVRNPEARSELKFMVLRTYAYIYQNNQNARKNA